MSKRFDMVLKVLESNDLLKILPIYHGAVQEALAEGAMPHMDPAVRLVGFHAALCSNSDYIDRKVYDKLYEYCVAKSNIAPNFDIINTPQEPPPDYTQQ